MWLPMKRREIETQNNWKFLFLFDRLIECFCIWQFTWKVFCKSIEVLRVNQITHFPRKKRNSAKNFITRQLGSETNAPNQYPRQWSAQPIPLTYTKFFEFFEDFEKKTETPRSRFGFVSAQNQFRFLEQKNQYRVAWDFSNRDWSEA